MRNSLVRSGWGDEGATRSEWGGEGATRAHTHRLEDAGLHAAYGHGANAADLVDILQVDRISRAL
jgi:hypothetical protein